MVLTSGRGEGRAGQLLGVKPEGDPLRRVAPDGQSAGNRLAGEAVAEAAHIASAGGMIRSAHRHSLRTETLERERKERPAQPATPRSGAPPARARGKSLMAPA